jgi:hypothetical protein
VLLVDFSTPLDYKKDPIVSSSADSTVILDRNLQNVTSACDARLLVRAVIHGKSNDVYGHFSVIVDVSVG